MRLWLLLALGCVACAPAPRGSTPRTDPAVRSNPATPAKDSPKGYAVAREGTVPAAPDVPFEEDALQPPEDVAGEGFALTPDQSQDLAKETVEPAKIEPTQTAPVAATDPNQPSATTTTRGFRVQLAALASAAEAESFRREAETRLSVGVHVVFESGLFKVRAGDYLDRAAAVALQTRARGYGYDAAWVVATEVQLQRP